MPEFRRPKFAASHSRYRRQQSPSRHSRITRLHAEQLEARLLMTVDAAWQAGIEPGAADTSAVISTPVNSVPAASSSASAQPFERFESDEQLRAWLLEAAVAEWGHVFGKPIHSWHSLYRPWFSLASIDGAVAGLPLAGLSNDYSSTNVQVEGVDEADLVETDGEYIYLCSNRDLVIIKAGIGEQLQVVSRVQLENQPVGMYLDGNRLAIISSTFAAGSGFNGVFRVIDITDSVTSYNETKIEPPTTTVTVLDITDRASPTLVQTIEMDGRLVTSRTVDGQLRLVLSNDINLPSPIARETNSQSVVPRLPSYWLTIDDRVLPPAEYVYETQDEYLSRVEDDILKAIRPRVRQLDVHGNVVSETSLFDTGEFYRADSLFDRQVTTIATFDLKDVRSRPQSQASVIGGPVEVYSSSDHLYLFSSAQQLMSLNGVSTPKTNIWKFKFDVQVHDVQLIARGRIDGQLLNQFAADEHNGYLRVVTTSLAWNSGGHGVAVLQQNGPRLQVVGSRSGIAADEQLFSVRFVDDRVFFVTFRVVDPLFAVDLSDPENPQLLGELHVTGYSDYLQPIDENTLLAIGRDADERTGLFQNLQISVFDVSNMSEPQLRHRHAFEGGRSTETPATGNRWLRGDGDHHAVSYFPAEQILALPVFFDGTLGSESASGGLQLFRIDPLNGFVPLGVIEHESRVVRSVRIDDRLYAISSGMVSVHQLENPELKLGMVDFSSESERHTVELTMQPLAMPRELEPMRFEPMQFEPMQTLAISSVEMTMPESVGPWWLPLVEQDTNEPTVHNRIVPTRLAVSRVDRAARRAIGGRNGAVGRIRQQQFAGAAPGG